MFPDTFQPASTVHPQAAPITNMDDHTVEPVKKTRNYGEWYDHVNKFKAQHPDMSHQDAVKLARGSYTKAPKKKRDTSTHKPNAWMKYVADWVKENPEWRQKYSYKEVLQLCSRTYKK